MQPNKLSQVMKKSQIMEFEDIIQKYYPDINELMKKAEGFTKNPPEIVEPEDLKTWFTKIISKLEWCRGIVLPQEKIDFMYSELRNSNFGFKKDRVIAEHWILRGEWKYGRPKPDTLLLSDFFHVPSPEEIETLQLVCYPDIDNFMDEAVSYFKSLYNHDAERLRMEKEHLDKVFLFKKENQSHNEIELIKNQFDYIMKIQELEKENKSLNEKLKDYPEQNSKVEEKYKEMILTMEAEMIELKNINESLRIKFNETQNELNELILTEDMTKDFTDFEEN